MIEIETRLLSEHEIIHAFPAGKGTCRKRGSDGKAQSRGRYEVGAGYEQYPQPSRRGRLQRLDLQLIPATQGIAAVNRWRLFLFSRCSTSHKVGSIVEGDKIYADI